MIRDTLTLFLLMLFQTFHAQVPSSCDVPSVLREAYERDVKGLVLQRMQELNSPDYGLIEIPQSWQDSILEGMAAILQAPLPESDSVFNRYCVHHAANNPVVYGLIIGVGTESAIAQAWKAGNTLTGNALLDNLLTTYGFTLENYLSSIGAGVLQTDRLLNLFALADSIVGNVQGVAYAEPNYLIGGAGSIFYDVDQTGNRYFDFQFEWNDCFDGCDSRYTWKFRVAPDCAVEFLGTEAWGVYGIEPLPDPVNCMLSTAADEPAEDAAFSLFPNPADSQLNFKNPPAGGNWRLLDATGRLLEEGLFLGQPVGISHLAPGAYWLQYRRPDGGCRVKAFFKQ